MSVLKNFILPSVLALRIGAVERGDGSFIGYTARANGTI